MSSPLDSTNGFHHALLPSAGIPGPLTERLIFAALCEAFRAARRAGLSIEEAAREADAVASRAAAIARGSFGTHGFHSSRPASGGTLTRSGGGPPFASDRVTLMDELAS